MCYVFMDVVKKFKIGMVFSAMALKVYAFEGCFYCLEFGLIPSAIAYDLLLFLYFAQYHSAFEFDHVCFFKRVL